MAITAGTMVDLPTTTIGVTGATGVVAAAAVDAGVPGPEPLVGNVSKRDK